MKRALLILSLFLSPELETFAQDPGFSQFFASPLTLNPALTGKFDGRFRLAVNYRDQWPSVSQAYITSTVSADMNLLQDRISEVDNWAIGFMGMADKTATGILKSNYFSFSTAYHKGLDEDGLHQIGVGFQGNYATQRLDGTKLNFEDELDQFGGWTNPTNEPLNDRMVSVNYFDFNAGILFNGSTDGYNNYYLGTSFYHINRPRQSFNGGFYLLNPRFTIHGGGYLPVSQSTVLHLSALHSRQTGASQTILGGALAMNANNDEENPTNFFAGSWIRFGDAIIPYVGLEFNDMRIGVTYDVNISSFKTASQSRGGIEISLIYVNRPMGRKNVPCPQF